MDALTQRGGPHAPVIVLNTTGSGVRTFIGCACGDRPKKVPQTMTGMDAGYRAHLRRIGMARGASIEHAVYTDGPAKGMTWAEWSATHVGDPFGQRNNEE